MLDKTALSDEIVKLVDVNILKIKRNQFSDSREQALLLTQMYIKILSIFKWNSVGELIKVLRQIGVHFQNEVSKDIISGNIVRRVLGIVRDESDIDGDSDKQENNAMMFSMFSLLSINKNQNKNKVTVHKKYVTNRTTFIRGLKDLYDEIANVNEMIETMSIELIHDNEILLTPSTFSENVLNFFLKAKTKRKFIVMIVENYPNNIRESHEFARKLTENDIETVLIPDTAIFAVMSLVGKVIIDSDAVFVNGGCISNSGSANVTDCAKEHKTPVFAVSDFYKFSPLYPYNIEHLLHVGKSSKVLDYSNETIVPKIDVVTNFLTDYIPPENIDIFITNIGGIAPSFIYKIILDYYKTEDNDLH